MARSNSAWASTGGADPRRARPRPSETARYMRRLPCGSEGEGQASHDPLTGLRLQPVHVVDHRHSNRHKPRQGAIGNPNARREVDNIPARVPVLLVLDHLFRATPHSVREPHRLRVEAHGAPLVLQLHLCCWYGPLLGECGRGGASMSVAVWSGSLVEWERELAA